MKPAYDKHSTCSDKNLDQSEEDKEKEPTQQT